MRKRLVAVVTLLAVVLTAVLIFGMSAQTAGRSNGLSLSVTRFLLRVFVPRYEGMTRLERYELLHLINGLVRKAAHVFEFTLFGAAVLLHLRVILPQESERSTAALTLATGVLYAALDEWHQSFVDGRGMLVRDVLIDACGLLCGITLMLLLLRLRRRRKKKSE